MRRVFVYGTLRRGEPNFALLKLALFVREAQTSPGHTLYALDGHPGMGPDGSTSVAGEVFEVDDETLTHLDALEGHPDWYLRVPITLADGETVETYILPSEFTHGRPVIAHGDWVRWRRY